MIQTEGRHPGTQQIARWLSPNPALPAGLPADIAAGCESLAEVIVATLPDGPELTAGLRKLLEAKDCFVRAAVADTSD